MDLKMSSDLGLGYTSRSQIARMVTEAWGAHQLFCAACDSDRVEPTPPNTKAIDFRCPRCDSAYQLKAGRQRMDSRIPDGAFSAMSAAIASDDVPNLLVLQYSPEWYVTNLMLVPSFLFTASLIEKRRPLSATARRAGWVGCNILLSALPSDAKIHLVRDCVAACPDVSWSRYESLRPLSTVRPSVRGWTLDVFKIVQEMGSREFTLAQVYQQESMLRALHPRNGNVRAKIRQQLQVLRDLGYLQFKGDGGYALTTWNSEKG